MCDLDEAEADVLHAAHSLAVFVEAGSHPHRVGEGDTERGRRLWKITLSSGYMDQVCPG